MMRLSLWTVMMAALAADGACTGNIADELAGAPMPGQNAAGGRSGGSAGGAPGSTASQPPGANPAVPPCEDPTSLGAALQDRLTPERLLRRASFALRGTPPTDTEYADLGRAGDVTAQNAFVAAFVDRTLADPIFYRTMFETALAWFNIPPVGPIADAPEYGPVQQRSLQQCPSGAWHFYRYDEKACDGARPDGSPADTIRVEPWWAPGTQVTLMGYAASQAAQGRSGARADGATIDCSVEGPEGNCGCGPHAIRCRPILQQPGWDDFVLHNERGQRRLLSEEPARLLAHLAWHDRPATDLILGTYSVAPVWVQSAYVMQGLATGGPYTQQLLDDDSWWNPAKLAGAVDPNHGDRDPWAWREYQMPARNPFFLADRNYRFDPRTSSADAAGIPAAGMLTSLGFLGAYPRERLRSARALEALACEVLAPPQGGNFNPYQRDPGTEGPCQHCHKRIDPGAIHFKRFWRKDAAFEGWGGQYIMPGVGKWHALTRAPTWRTGKYPYDREPFTNWNRWFSADTLMTPVTAAQIAANPEAAFIDFLPSEQTLLDQTGDGTVGPLGFAKLIVKSGAFDRCVVRHLHQMVIGRDIDPALEVGYLDTLAARFTQQDGRKIRAFIKYLTKSDLFARGL